VTRPSIWSQWHRHRDPLLTLAALALSVATSLPTGGSGRSSWEVLLAVLAWLPLLVRKRWPLPVAAAVVLVDSVHIAVAGHHGTTTVPVATMLAIFTVSDMRPPRIAWGTAALAGAIQATVAARTRPNVGADLLYLNWTLVAAAVGQLVQERRERVAAAEQRAEAAERSKHVEAQRQVSAERMRIARELHDVLAHHITVVNAQAGVAQYLLHSNPDAAEQALQGIADNSRDALNELRATLGLLRSDGDEAALDAREPAPRADRLPDLIDGFVAAGMPLTASIQGTPRPLDAAADLALYRISQEALTNASKHAPGSSVQLSLDWTDTGATLTVRNSTAPQGITNRPARLAGEGTGHGLIGMRERAAVAGGSLIAGGTSDGGYEIHVTLPAAQQAGSSVPEPDEPDSAGESR
jgi:signal transduction histidine kinase